MIDGDSADDTARIAQRAGATVHREGELMPSYGPVLGKGDAMWRALSVLEGDLVCFLDADVFEFSTRYPIGLLGPLVEFDEVSFVKAHYRRPFHHGDAVVPDGGGRVNHLLARPYLAVFHPLLAGVRQPLAGEIAARRTLLERCPSRPDTASSSRCSWTCWTRSGSRAWRRSISRSTTTAISRSRRSARCPTAVAGAGRAPRERGPPGRARALAADQRRARVRRAAGRAPADGERAT